MKNEKYSDRIINYIKDNRFTQALLIDGDWGCGKSYYVKNNLIPLIDKTPINETYVDKMDDEHSESINYYHSILVSLYGLTTIKDIQSNIYTACIEKTAESTENKITKTIIRNASLIGNSVLYGIGSHFNVKDEVEQLAEVVNKNILSNKKNEIVLIFDDLERCRIDIIELMGFLNNLCENNGYKVIMVANEREVEKHQNEIATAIQSSAALIDIEVKDFLKNKNGSNGSVNYKEKRDRGNTYNQQKDIDNYDSNNSLEIHRANLFGDNDIYLQTREKLVGLTIHFESNMPDIFNALLDSTVDEDDIKNYLRDNKEIIIEQFVKNDHSNLRTLISFFIASENIFSLLKLDMDYGNIGDLEYEKIVSDEKEKILIYLVLTAINKANGFTAINLKGKRFASIGGYYIDNVSPIFAYAFVDEYWKSLVPNEEVIKNDFHERIKGCVNQKIRILEDENHKNLALYKLKEWYYLPDSEVKDNLIKLKTELKEKKYFVWEFKDIIYVLMCINNPGFGMNPQGKETVDFGSSVTYDPTDDYSLSNERLTTQSGNKNTIKKIEGFDNWIEENIKEYVKEMCSYIEDKNVAITKEMFRIFFSDKKLAAEYRSYIDPILEIIDRRKINMLKQVESDGMDVLDNWDDNLYKYFRENRDDYLSEKAFISLYGYDKIEKKLISATAKEVFMFSDAVSAVYNFSNLREFFYKDYDDVNRIWNELKKDKENGRLKYNKNKERTKEISLRRLEVNFEEYRNALMDPIEKYKEAMEEKD